MTDSKADWRTLYPFADHECRVEGYRYHYVDEGAGQPVVMVHGNPTWSFMYRRLIADLSPTHRVIAPDNIGCGMSDKPQDYSYRLENHITNLEQLLNKELDLSNITLVVHDWGGAIGGGYAVRHPDRVSRIVAMNTAAFLMRQCPWRIRACRIPVLGSIAVRNFNAFARAAIFMAVHNHDRITPEIKAGYLAPYHDYESRIATLRFVQDIPLKPSHPSWKTLADIEKGLAHLQDKPIRLFWGMRDFCFNQDFLVKWQKYFPEAEVDKLKNAGHYLLEDAYEEILPKLRKFLA